MGHYATRETGVSQNLGRQGRELSHTDDRRSRESKVGPAAAGIVLKFLAAKYSGVFWLLGIEFVQGLKTDRVRHTLVGN